MNFINEKKLALRFKNNAVPSKERFLYLLMYVTMAMLCGSSILSSTAETNQLDVYIDIVCITISIIGTIICYKTNKAGDDKEFIERYISLSFPITVFTLLLLFLIAFVLGIFSTLLDNKIIDSIVFLLILLVTIYYYWRLNSAIKIASSSS